MGRYHPQPFSPMVETIERTYEIESDTEIRRKLEIWEHEGGGQGDKLEKRYGAGAQDLNLGRVVRVARRVLVLQYKGQ